jgi:exopolysaccharide production protein ExoZ
MIDRGVLRGSGEKRSMDVGGKIEANKTPSIETCPPASIEPTEVFTADPAKLPEVTSKGSMGRTRTEELQSVQALRALAATTVIFAHVPFINRGGFGVAIFFVISGFIICYISSINPSHFWLKRVFRVVPLYWIRTFGVFLIALVAPHLLNFSTARLDELLKSLFFIPFWKESGRAVPLLFLGWTLEYEMFFYLLFAVALAISKKWAGGLAVLALAAIAIAGRLTHPHSIFLRFYSRSIIMEFTLGIFAFFLWKNYRQRLARLSLPLAALVALAGYAIFFWTDQGIPPSIQFAQAIPVFLFQGGLGFVILMCFLSMEGKISFPRWVLAIGDASYSLYLFHPYIVQLASRKIVSFAAFTPLSLATLIVTVGVCFLFAIASFKLVERPSNNLLRRTFRLSRAGLSRGHAG